MNMKKLRKANERIRKKGIKMKWDLCGFEA